MKKILVSLALAAAVLNGTLASAGSASLSASELQVDGVEMMAEGECIPWDKIYKVLKTYGKPALEAIGALDAACSLYDAVFGDDSESQPRLAYKFAEAYVDISTGHGYTKYECKKSDCVTEMECAVEGSTLYISF